MEQELRAGIGGWEAREKTLLEQAAQVAARCAELDKQVDLMQQQMVTMSNRMAAVTRVQETAVR